MKQTDIRKNYHYSYQNSTWGVVSRCKVIEVGVQRKEGSKRKDGVRVIKCAKDGTPKMVSATHPLESVIPTRWIQQRWEAHELALAEAEADRQKRAAERQALIQSNTAKNKAKLVRVRSAIGEAFEFGPTYSRKSLVKSINDDTNMKRPAESVKVTMTLDDLVALIEKAQS